MYATDIACSKWKSFKVKAPIYNKKYIVEKISYDNRLWDYIILRDKDIKFLFAHTKSNLKVNDTVKSKQEIWYTNLSWMSENYHTHLELWKWDNNISLENFIKGNIIINPKSKKLREQRWWEKKRIIWPVKTQEILRHLSDWEWLHLSSYKDGPTRYSIWYWTKSHKGEVITKSEANHRWRKVIWHIVEKYKINNIDLNKQKAIVSYVFNIWSLSKQQKQLLNNKMYCWLGNNFIKYIHSNWKVLRWLVKRRNNEKELLCSN
jgi:GH24 family phage-related lysozyme (muramidase)